MKLYFSFALLAQLLIAILSCDKTRVAYLSYLAEALFLTKTNDCKPVDSKKLITLEAMLQPVHD